jgi:adenine/guanine phosphoribosyltransferase-like PRPP-binding protein
MFEISFYLCKRDNNDMGVTFDDTEKKFVFDFEHDGAEDIVSLTGSGYQVEAFGKCFYYGYEFSEQIESSIRSAFIKYVKFTDSLQDTPDLTNFIKKAVDNLHKKINLYNFDLVVMPESSSKVNQYMLRYIYRFAQPTLYKMTLVKALPSNISFDMKAYEEQYLNDILEDGRPRYSEAAKEQAKNSINAMLEMIHQKDYFTIAKDVKKSRLRPYIMNFLKFKSDEDKELCSIIRQQNVLVIDDVTTSGSTLNEVLRTLRILNEDNEITIFSLIGRKDLMADSL